MRRTIVVTNSYNKCLTKSLEFFLDFFLFLFFLFEISHEELYSVWQSRQRKYREMRGGGRGEGEVETETNKKSVTKKKHHPTTDKSINLKIYITLYVVTCATVAA